MKKPAHLQEGTVAVSSGVNVQRSVIRTTTRRRAPLGD